MTHQASDSLAKHRHVPLNTAHRGFSAKYPENSILAMQKAVSEAGADIIETDIQVSGDGQVVISHDPNTKRCFGEDHVITETSYADVLSHLKTIKAPHVGMPLLKDVAQMLVDEDETSGSKATKIMLDIKRSNEPWVIKKIVAALLEVKDDLAFWTARIILGIWSLDLLQACIADAPEFDVLHIGVSHSLAQAFLLYDNCIGLSLFYGLWGMPYRGAQLYLQTKAMGKVCYAWTINSDILMKWTIVSRFDGIITDKPDRFHQLVENHEAEVYGSVDGDSSEELSDEPKLHNQGYFTLVQRFVLFPLLWVLIKGFRGYLYVYSSLTRKRPMI